MVGYYDKEDKKTDKKTEKTADNKPIKPDNWIEKTHLRPLAAKEKFSPPRR